MSEEQLLELQAPAWHFCTWWRDALTMARYESARTGRRFRVKRSRVYPRMWFVVEAPA